MYVYTYVCAYLVSEARKGCQVTWIGAMDNCVALCECWESHLGPGRAAYALKLQAAFSSCFFFFF